MQTRSSKRKTPNTPTEPNTVPIPKHPKHIFYDDEDDDTPPTVPPLIEDDEENEKDEMKKDEKKKKPLRFRSSRPVSKSKEEVSSSSSEEEDDDEEEEEEEWMPALEDDDEEEDEEDEEEDDDQDDPEDEEDEWQDYYDDEDLGALRHLRTQNKELYDRFILARDIIQSREVSLQDILRAQLSDDKRANLIEQYEILRQTPACTEEYLEQRDKIRTLLYRYMIDKIIPTVFPSTSSTSSTSSLTADAARVFPRLARPDQQVELANMRQKVALLECSPANRKVLEEKIEEFEDIDKGDERSKIKRWINQALSIPFDRLTADTDLRDLNVRLKQTAEYLDQKLFGMKRVKERLMLFLNKKLREGGSRGCNIALVGKPGVGKCLHPDTPVRLFDRSVKRAGDVVTGDRLMGDDGTAREVLSTITGEEEMFTIHQAFGDAYTVNRSHILSLVHRTTREVEDIPLVEFVEGRKHPEDYTPYYSSDWISNGISSLSETETGQAFGRALCEGTVPSIWEGWLDWHLARKEAFAQGVFSVLVKEDQQVMKVNVAPASLSNVPDCVEFFRRAGVRVKWESSSQVLVFRLPGQSSWEKWSITSIGVGQYAGFTIDGNRRFLLGDWTVTHNTAIAKCLSQCLQIPFAQLSFGGVTNAEFLMGHDYTYIGSRPGEITRCMTRLGVKNGILFFDEFDKVTDKKDIMSTLLHVTDFSQNGEFRDNYFPELTQDLSKVWFIYSMNELPSDPAMLDRLEVIYVDEYSTDERVHISQEYLFPRYVNELKLADKVKMDASGVRKLVDFASGGKEKQGVRELERIINLVVEKVYFYLSNQDQPYTYGWFTTTKKNHRDGVVHINESLVDAILKDKADERNQRTSYLNMYL